MKKDSNKHLCTIYLTRHGQTMWNEAKITQGQSDSQISQKGILQAEALREELRDIEFSAIYSSDLSMARRTAEIIKLERKLNVQTSKLLRGRSYGIFEGKSVHVYRDTLVMKFDERKSLSEDEFSSFRLAPSVETEEELAIRTVKKLKKIAQSHLCEDVLVVTHGGCIKNFLIRIGYKKRELLPEGFFKHGTYIKVLSDGKNFFIDDIKKPKNNEYL